jgi:IS30 family transposase
MKKCCLPKKYNHITLEDRGLIQIQLQQGFTSAAIAADVNRPYHCLTACDYLQM